MTFKNIPIIKSNEYIEKYSVKNIVTLLENSPVVNISGDKQIAIGVCMNVKYDYKDDTYYSDIYIKDDKYENIKIVKAEYCFDDNEDISVIIICIKTNNIRIDKFGEIIK